MMGMSLPKLRGILGLKYYQFKVIYIATKCQKGNINLSEIEDFLVSRIGVVELLQ